jgi:O-antigen/teichoic acid export membrane protein
MSDGSSVRWRSRLSPRSRPPEPSPAEAIDAAAVAAPPSTGDGLPAEGPRGVAGGLLQSAGWNTASELAPVVVNVTLTPFLIHGLGVERYGIYALAATITIFLNSFDGGLSGASQRFFSVNAGRDDKPANTRLLISLTAVVLVGAGALSAATCLAAPWLVELFRLPLPYRAGAVFLIRTFSVLVTINLVTGMVTALLKAHQRFRLTSQARIASYLAWAAGLVLTVVDHTGLIGVAYSLIAEQVVITIIVVPACLSHLERSAVGFLRWSELRPVLAFGGNVQVTGLTGLVNMQLNGIVIAAVLPVAFVGLYNAGANPATQLFYVSVAGVAPLASHFGRTYGERGEAAARGEMAAAQRIWVAAMGGLVAVELGAAYFAVVAWLGPRFSMSAWVTELLLGGYGVALFGAVLSVFTIAIGQPRIQVRAAVLGMVLNVVLTIPLAFVGVLWVVAATTAGQVAATVYLVHGSRRELGRSLPNPLRDLPVLRCLGCAALTLGLEALVRPVVPAGPLGLLACGVPAALGLGAYALAMLGVRRTMMTLRRAVAERSFKVALAGTPFG